MAAVYGDEVDPAVVADLSVGFGQFIERFVVDQGLLRDDINKVSFLGSPMTIDSIRAEFAGELDIVPGTVAKFGANSGEMSLPGIHKATAIELVLAHLGIAREDTIAFGDSTNDIEMIQFVATGCRDGRRPPGRAHGVRHDHPEPSGGRTGARVRLPRAHLAANSGYYTCRGA